MDEKVRRRNLGEFLQMRRTRLKPTDVGLSLGTRRRTPGLRREEVAQLANISTSWYTSLEQGREMQASEEVLENIANALLLNVAERQHLFLLAKRPVDLNFMLIEDEITPTLAQWIHTLHDQPAYILGRRWDILVWNHAADLLFNFSKKIPPHTNNYLWRFFHNTDIKNRPTWRPTAKQVIAQFRADSTRYLGDSSISGLIKELLETSDTFREEWSRYDVQELFNGNKQIYHPSFGVKKVGQVTLQVPNNPHIKIIILTNVPLKSIYMNNSL